MSPDDYHAATRQFAVDVLAGHLPRLRIKPDIPNDKPLATRTLRRMIQNMCLIYKLLSGKEANADRDNFHDNGNYGWLLDTAAVTNAAYRPDRKYKHQLSGYSIARRLEAAAQLADMVHSDEHLAAATVYRETVKQITEASKKRKREQEPRWTKVRAQAELDRIHKILVDEKDSADTLQWITCAGLFGTGATDKHQPLRGGNWRRVRYGDEPHTHPTLDDTPTAYLQGDPLWLICFGTGTKTDSNLSQNLSETCPLLAEVLLRHKQHAIDNQDGWVLPPRDYPYDKKRNQATEQLLGKRYTANDARHLVYCAAHGNTLERAEEARLRGSTAAAAAAYGDK